MLGVAILTACGKEGRKEKEENERQIETSALPQAVKTAINRDYPGAELLEADEITQDDNSLTYDIEIKASGTKMEVMYDANGKFLGTEADDDDDDEDDEDGN